MRILVAGGPASSARTSSGTSRCHGDGPGEPDKLTYAGKPRELADMAGEPRTLPSGGICDAAESRGYSRRRSPRVVNSPPTARGQQHRRPGALPADENLGTQVCSRGPPGKSPVLQISTARCTFRWVRGRFSEESPLNPTQPYAATRRRRPAGAGSKDVGSRRSSPCSNNYGPTSFPRSSSRSS